VWIPLKKVLIVAYHYPPLGGGGVFRTLKFTKYLPKFGYQPYVLTVKNPMYSTKDPTLLKEIPSEVKIFRTFSFEHRILRAPRLLKIDLKWFYIPDENIGWLPFAVYNGVKIIKNEKIDVIYATAPVWTSLLIGFLLKKKTKKPLIIDFRDPWTDNAFIEYPTRLHESIERKMEEKVLKLTDHIITTTEPMTLRLIDKYPFIKEKCTTITNGFDAEDFKDFKKKGRREKFTIAHVGSIYGLITSKYWFLALKELIEEKTELRSAVEVFFIGRVDDYTRKLVEKLGVKNVVKLVGYVPHKKSLKLMVESDVLLLLMGFEEADKVENGALRVPGKVYEYLATKKPILALIPKGAAADLIMSTKSGVIVPPKDVPSIKEVFFKLFQQWQKGTLMEVKSSIRNYDRKVLTKKLTEVFENLTT
jgi:glycosyltransferase involved in cell wall biosynthesis